ncbi:Sulfite exporter TauE/SafE [Methylibium sp. T29-B]|uniref:anion permease n=1 Tax=Methylibium sp. T29-B TaxID=1437443 RepID=UPI0003F44153|nr:anion permease [Methylibium sp. T29-B]EWS58349.1 Sulfite exporter TauE/SafE [Methylibium sp. T29-B]
MLLLYGAWGLLRPALPRPAPRHEDWLGALAGAVSGLLTAATGVFVLPLVPYLQSLRMDRDELVQALGLSFTLATVALGLVLWQAAPQAATPDATDCGVALLAAFAGLWSAPGCDGACRRPLSSARSTACSCCSAPPCWAARTRPRDADARR